MKIEQIITELKYTLPDYKFRYKYLYPLVQRDRVTGRFTSWHYDYLAISGYEIDWVKGHPVYGNAVGYCFISSELAEDNNNAFVYLSNEIPKDYYELVARKDKLVD